jgi:hypothetical protein
MVIRSNWRLLIISPTFGAALPVPYLLRYSITAPLSHLAGLGRLCLLLTLVQVPLGALATYLLLRPSPTGSKLSRWLGGEEIEKRMP